MKLTWKVADTPKGPYCSFEKRAWPTAYHSNGKIAAQIYCEDSYRPAMVKSGTHRELTVMVAEYSDTEWKWRTVTKRFSTLDLAKEGALDTLNLNPKFVPADVKEEKNVPKKSKIVP